MKRFEAISEKVGGLSRVPLRGVIVTHGKSGICGSASQKKPTQQPSEGTIYCKACGIIASPDTLYNNADILPSDKQEMCISTCGFACFPGFSKQ